MLLGAECSVASFGKPTQTFYWRNQNFVIGAASQRVHYPNYAVPAPGRSCVIRNQKVFHREGK